MPRQGFGAGQCQGHFVFAGGGIDFVRLHRRQRSRLLRRRCLDLDPHELRSDGLAQTLAHRFKQAERFRLVFIERIALAVAAESDHLAQMIEHDQVLAPEMVQRLQKDRLLDVADDVRAPLRHLGRHVLVGAALDAGENLLVGDAFFSRPFIGRKIEREHALELFAKPNRVPLFRIGVFRHVLCH